MRLAARLQRRLSATFALDADLVLELSGERPVAALFGASGCGKSTVLAALAGLLPGTEGHVELSGETLLDTAAGVCVPPERRHVALVAQDGLLFPHLNVHENLRYADRRAADRARPRVAQVLDVLELGPLSDRRPEALSGGERQRVALGRALLSGPRLLLLDEPVSALDERARWRVLGFVERVVAEFAVPTLYVSHARVEVLRLAHTAARMEAGRIVEIGDPAHVLATRAPGAVWNLLHARGAAPAGEHSPMVRVGDAELFGPEPVGGGDDVWLRLSSAAIALHPAGSAIATSARNRLPARVLHLAEEGGRIRVAVDAGIPLQVDLTPSAVRDLALAPGSEVLCEFKAYALERLG